MPHGVISSFEGTMTFFAAVSHTHKKKKACRLQMGFQAALPYRPTRFESRRLEAIALRFLMLLGARPSLLGGHAAGYHPAFVG